MPNEFKVKNGLIVDQGGATITGSLSVSGSITTSGLSTGSVLFTSGSNGIITGSANLFWDNTNGRLGIKRTPAVEIDVDGSIRASSIIFTSTAQLNSIQTNGANLTIKGASNVSYITMFQSTGNLLLQNGGTFTDAGYRLDVNGNAKIKGSGATSATTALRVENTNASASLVVLDNGSVGIGTTNPSFTLDVSGSGRFTNGLTVTGSISQWGGGGVVFYDNTSNGGGKIHGGYGYANGEVYITPLSGLNNNFIFSPNNGMSIGGFTIGGTAGSPPAYGLAVSGSIGIGTRVPTAKLDVIGSARITNGLTVTGSSTISGSSVITGSLQVGIPGTNDAAIDTTVGTLSRGTQARVDWLNGSLYNTSGVLTADWENTALYDSSGVLSLAWNDRVLYTPGGNSFAWDNEYHTTSTLYQYYGVSLTTQNDFIDNLSSPFVGQIIEGVIDAAATAGQLVNLEPDGIWYSVKNIAPNATKMLGICVNQSKGIILLEGDVGVSDDNTFGTYVVSASMGLPVYVGTANGDLDTTQPTNGVVRTVGHIYYQSTTTANYWLMKFRPSNDWYEQ